MLLLSLSRLNYPTSTIPPKSLSSRKLDIDKSFLYLYIQERNNYENNIFFALSSLLFAPSRSEYSKWMDNMNEFKTNEAGIQLIKSFESLHDGDLTLIGLQPKMCPAGIWTEGYGHAIIYRGKHLKGGHYKELAYLVSTVKTEAEAEQLLAQDLAVQEDLVRKYVKVPLTLNQFSALVSFVYNVGEGNFSTSSLLKGLNNGDYILASEEFRKWINVNKKPLKGLIRRRAAERHLFTMASMKEIMDAIAVLSQPLPLEDINKTRIIV